MLVGKFLAWYNIMEPTLVQTFLSEAKFFDSGHTLEQVSVALFWFGGGIFTAFVLCAFSMVHRATRGASGDTSL